jgi:polysaccharide deacetylase family protein (PEP-CTERM system associated)
VSAAALPARSILTVDVEDWFHILDLPSAPGRSDWDRLPSRVEGNFRRLLDIFDEHQVRVTCFFLGWIAERHREIVRDAARRGHEIASHGYGHTLVYEMTPEEFARDASDSRKLLEDISGSSVLGYRSAGFSTTESTPWFFDKLLEAGYSYDSSIFPAARQHGGQKTAACAPYLVKREPWPFVEFPITVAEVLGKRICFFGGGYLRLFPYWIVRKMAGRVHREGRPVIFYVHPREIDPDQPRMKMGLMRKFKSYVNLRTTEPKIRGIVSDFELTTFRDYLRENPEMTENARLMEA